MLTIKQLALTTAIILICLLATAQGQMPRMTTVNISAQSDRVHISTEGDISELRVDVADEQGEVVFQSEAITGNILDWNMRDTQGVRVAPGTYFVTVTFHNAAGKLRKRVEQVTVEEALKPGTEQAAPRPAAPDAVQATITGAGAANKLAKFTGAATIASSIITESAGKIGIGTPAPASLLTVIGNVGVPVASVTNNSTTLTSIALKGVSNSGHGVRGESKYIGVYGLNSASTRGAGVWGRSSIVGGTGVLGEATNGASYGVWGKTSTGRAVYGEGVNGFGVYGTNTGGNVISVAAIYGLSTATDGTGIKGEANNGTEAFAIWGKSTNGEAGHFTGKVVVNGNLDVLGTVSKDAGSFKIDHPLDPANKYLYHSFVESPDMMNIYNGNVTLDGYGEAVVAMPRWFSALNREFRYQLTAIGAPGPNLYIAEEMKGTRFRIAGGTPGMKVSWQVTGIRKDAYAEAHRIPVEQEKPERERGSFLHPELYGQSEEKGVEQARYPEKMRRAKESETQQPPGKQ